MTSLRIALLPALAVAFLLAGPAIGEESVSYKNLLTPLLETGTDTLDQPDRLSGRHSQDHIGHRHDSAGRRDRLAHP